MHKVLTILLIGWVGWIQFSLLSEEERSRIFRQLETSLPEDIAEILRNRISTNCGDTTVVSMCLLKKYGIKFDTIVMCQHILETGWEHNKSDIYLKGNNAFGMKNNNRGHLNGVYKGHASYPSIVASIKDYAHWQAERLYAYEKYTGKKVITENDYLLFLENLFPNNSRRGFASYAEWKDANSNGIWDYREKIKRLKSQIF